MQEWEYVLGMSLVADTGEKRVDNHTSQAGWGDAGKGGGSSTGPSPTSEEVMAVLKHEEGVCR